MLTLEQFNQIEKEAKKIYDGLELEIIEEIAERIANVGYANTVVVSDVLIAQELGLLYQDVVELVSKYDNTNQEIITEIFVNAGIETIEYDNKIYKSAGLNPNGISSSMIQLLEATAIRTNFNLKNLTMTTANTSQTAFYNAINKAYLETITGIKSYSTAIIDAIKELSAMGVMIQYPSGYRTSIENAVRMNILTSVNQTAGQVQLMQADEMGCDLMEITAHSGARPTHAEWQGKIVSRSGHAGYLTLDEIGYGKVDGFQGINCRHSWFPYYDTDIKTYTNKELKDLKNETVTYNGKKISKYEASQIQRKLERQIRSDKKILAGLQGILNSNMTSEELLKARTDFSRNTLIYKSHQQELNDFLSQTSSKSNNLRTYVGNYSKSISTSVANVSKIANKYNNSDIVGTVVNGVEITEVGEHIISQTYARNVNFEDVLETLNNPVEFGIIRKDNSQQIKGENCTVVINIKTGKLITTYPKKTKRE